MVAASASFTAMAATAKLASTDVSPFVSVLARSIVIVAVALTLIRLRGARIRFRAPRLLLARAAFGFAAMCCYFWALGNGPLADVIALQYTAPLFVGALAPVLLGEAVTPRTWSLLAVGFVGAVVLLRPGGEVHVALLAAVASALFAAIAYLSVRALAATDDPDCVVLFFALFATILSLPALALLDGVPDARTLAALLGVGLFAAGGQLGITRAYAHGEAAVVSGISYITVPMGAAVAALGFAEPVTLHALGGGVLVVGAGVGLALTRRKAPVSDDRTARRG